jgi:hypothetical protein
MTQLLQLQGTTGPTGAAKVPCPEGHAVRIVAVVVILSAAVVDGEFAYIALAQPGALDIVCPAPVMNPITSRLTWAIGLQQTQSLWDTATVALALPTTRQSAPLADVTFPYEITVAYVGPAMSTFAVLYELTKR